MQSHAYFKMNYDGPQPRPMIFNLNSHSMRDSDFVGRDVYDAALGTTYGPNSLTSFRLWVEDIGVTLADQATEDA